jgi:cytochrome c oxidase subunit IV
VATQTETTHTHDEADVDHGGGPSDHHGDHPSDGQYWKIFFLLVIITAIEVGLYYFSIPVVNLNSVTLGVFAAAKFVIVVGYFMHLKFDNKILRRLFVTGLTLAAAVYVAYLLTMGVFIDHRRPHKGIETPKPGAGATAEPSGETP